MSARSPDPAAEHRYRDALARHRLQDVQPLYRKLLVRLKARDPEEYERAVARYGESLLPAVEGGNDDPLTLWIEYGRWLAGLLHAGRAVAVDETGRAAETEGLPPPGSLLLHVPGEDRAPVFALAVPEEPSEPQKATLELLCG